LLPVYFERISKGGIAKKYKITTLKRAKNLLLLDGDGGPGQSIANHCIDKSRQLALKHGSGFVVVRNSNHVGMLASYAQELAESGLISIIMTNSGPSVAIPGVYKKIMGNNAICFGIPAQPEPVIFDFATGVVACGKVRVAAMKEEDIPAGWVKTIDGSDTTDPEVFDQGGPMLPFGDYKGYSLCLMVDILTAVLAGGKPSFTLLPQRKSPDKNTAASQTFITLDPLLMNENFYSDISSFINGLRSLAQNVILPGEIESKHKDSLLPNEITVHKNLLKELDASADKHGFPNTQKLIL
jgi:LDH2 family malate/lactate/ureidoglycolate dehydrogenase